ncbi:MULTISPECIES: hypothetical protein [Nocardiopsis]|uniref:Uncharacterized protein n=2 Tax=Nocardiopsis TaxID=2013 RepID=D7B7S2_NOCDD|nr:hypothetical protein [Nocardiopsis dassonvillei]ADH69467.1 hypothetical protein Ndas_4071 [Nocardiopsis dassonvillei subsp. dassonvillei DSM 43111]VEI89977.1 Uncharacterised protein [Nocardiopsis dassonvillei]
MVTGALPRPARHTTALLTSVVLLVILSFPVASGGGRPAGPPLPPHGLLSAPEGAVAAAADQERVTPRERADLAENPMVTVGPPASTCDHRSVLRDLPDTVPSSALRLAVWDQPWWPLSPPAPVPVPDLDAPGELPPTRAPPPTANTAI